MLIVFLSFLSNIPTYQKRWLLHTLLHRSFSICCDFKPFHLEFDHLKTILRKNIYTVNFSNSCIKSFVNKLYAPNVIVQDVRKRNVFVKMPFLGNTSLQIRKKFQKLFNDKLTFCNLKIVFTSPDRFKSYITFQDKLPKMYFQDLFTSISVVAAMLPLIVRPNVILKSEFVNM